MLADMEPTEVKVPPRREVVPLNPRSRGDVNVARGRLRKLFAVIRKNVAEKKELEKSQEEDRKRAQAFVAATRQGIPVRKVPFGTHLGPIRNRVFWINDSTQRIQITKSVNTMSGKGVYLLDLCAVWRGLRTPAFVFNPDCRGIDEDCCASLIASERTIDVIFETPERREWFVEGMSALLRSVRLHAMQEGHAQFGHFLNRKKTMADVVFASQAFRMLKEGFECERVVGRSVDAVRIWLADDGFIRMRRVKDSPRRDAEKYFEPMGVAFLVEVRGGMFTNSFQSYAISLSPTARLRGDFVAASIISAGRTIDLLFASQNLRDDFVRKFDAYIEMYSKGDDLMRWALKSTTSRGRPSDEGAPFFSEDGAGAGEDAA